MCFEFFGFIQRFVFLESSTDSNDYSDKIKCIYIHLALCFPCAVVLGVKAGYLNFDGAMLYPFIAGH